MDTAKQIQIAVARADLAISAAIRWLVVILLLTVALLLAVLAFRRLGGFDGHDQYWIDYDAPDVDITSEGPDDGDHWFSEGW